MKWTLVAVAVAAASMPLLAEETPEQTAAAYFAGMKETNFNASVKHLHPTDLARIRGMIVPFLEKAAQTNGFPARLLAFTKDNTIDEIRRLTPQEVFVRLMSWGTASNPMLVTFLKATNMEPLGSVKDGESMHIVCRQTITMDGAPIRTTATLVTVTKDNGEWKVTQPATVQIVVQQFTGMGGMDSRPSIRPSASSVNARPPSFGPVAPRDVNPQEGHNHPPAAAPKTATEPAPSTPASPTVAPAVPAPPAATPTPAAK